MKYDSNLPEIYVNELRRLRQITETLNNDKSLLDSELERLRSDVLDLRQEWVNYEHFYFSEQISRDQLYVKKSQYLHNN